VSIDPALFVAACLSHQPTQVGRLGELRDHRDTQYSNHLDTQAARESRARVAAIRFGQRQCCGRSSQSTDRSIDIELDRLGSLHGEIGIADCQSADIARVLVYHGRQLMAEAVVTGDGGFRIDGLSGGVYWLSAPGTGRAVRAWSQGCLDV
tara:strand:+ start:227 stop:679 length:453 start_codon:yes stop_codon:yes gene_type:complete